MSWAPLAPYAVRLEIQTLKAVQQYMASKPAPSMSDSRGGAKRMKIFKSIDCSRIPW